MNVSKDLVFVTWSSSVIGECFSKYYGYCNDTLVFTLGRTPIIHQMKSTQHLIVDLLQKEQVMGNITSVLEPLRNELIKNVYIVHGAWKSKNELLWITPIIDLDADGMDDEMYAAQIETFDNTYSCVHDFIKLQKRFDDVKFTVVGMWSLLDTCDSPIHKSMREINNLMRSKLQILAKNESNHHTIMLSLSTVATESEKQYRKFADQSYWLSWSEVVDKSIETISHRKNIYEDIPIYKYHPLYESYFKYETNEQRIIRFKKEIGLK